MRMRVPGVMCGLTLAATMTVMAGAENRPPGRHVVVATAPDFIADVVGPYLAMQESLVKDELGPVAAAAASLQKGAAAIGADGAAMVAAAGKAREAKTLEAARAAFGDLSAALIAYADRAKQPIEGKVVAFCPMANKAWVQADGTIANPYYGTSMATCGSVQRKLSATK